MTTNSTKSRPSIRTYWTNTPNQEWPTKNRAQTLPPAKTRSPTFSTTFRRQTASQSSKQYFRQLPRPLSAATPAVGTLPASVAVIRRRAARVAAVAPKSSTTFTWISIIITCNSWNNNNSSSSNSRLRPPHQLPHNSYHSNHRLKSTTLLSTEIIIWCHTRRRIE